MKAVGSGGRGPSVAGGGGPAPQFFVDYKKGEVNELKNLLHSVNLNNDKAKKKEVIKKAIAYMTLGLDVSRLYPEMVKASFTTNISQKKMIYHYLTHYAKENQEHSVMATNTFHKDTQQKENPRIRGLALRHLCSLQFAGAEGYLLPAITDGLTDPDPYVRRIAIIGARKLFAVTTEDNFNHSDLKKRLYELTQDSNALVVTNALQVLDEIEPEGVKFNAGMITMLLNRMKEFNEFGQGIILDIVSRYKPSSKEETLSIMNVLEERFKNASAVVVLATVKIFLNYAKIMEGIAQQVYERLTNPLIILMSGGESNSNYEQVFVVLSHMKLLAAAGVAKHFQSEFKLFFCNDSDPSYIKNLKLEMLVMLANETNLQQIVDELGHYVIDVDADLARKAIQSIGKMAVRLSEMSRPICYHLRTFLQHNIDYISTETIIVLKDILRKYPDYITEFVTSIDQCAELVQDEDGRAALMWILGEFGGPNDSTNFIQNAPYLLEDMFDSLSEIDSPVLQNHMLTATAKLFFKRPPQAYPLLKKVITQYSKASVNPDTHDKALFYYRLLKSDPELAKQVILAEKNPQNGFFEDKNEQLYQQLFNQYNSISVVTMQPEEKFIKKEHLNKKRNDFLKEYQPLGGDDDDQTETSSTPASAPPPQEEQKDLLGLDDDDVPSAPSQPKTQGPDLLESFNPVAQTPPTELPDRNPLDILGGDIFGAPVAQPLAEVQLDANGKIDPGTFEKLWITLPECLNESFTIMPPITSLEMADSRFSSNKIPSLATGKMGNDLKLFLSAISVRPNDSQTDKNWFLCEVLVKDGGSSVGLKLKCQDIGKKEGFVNHFKKVIGAL